MDYLINVDLKQDLPCSVPSFVAEHVGLLAIGRNRDLLVPPSGSCAFLVMGCNLLERELGGKAHA